MTQLGVPFLTFTIPGYSERLLANTVEPYGEREVLLCPENTDHDEGDRRIGPIYFEVMHKDRD